MSVSLNFKRISKLVARPDEGTKFNVKSRVAGIASPKCGSDGTGDLCVSFLKNNLKAQARMANL
jgi:hypothetical protein